ncbi:Hypothetical predicted protein [Mytilus galloprovincialis]|uniref:Uncharacterized protein n=1 Tax=Mytilus galloprovincialis TaxID=29158 RepID=A0A8B6FCU3_MYTGA|nr:Hypothetical predicted protein [Mytilus galloprovincialis]
MRKSIDDFLTKLEQQILDDLESKHSKFKSKLVNLVQQMEKQTSPDDGCFVRNNIVAVTLGPTNETALVDVEKNQIIENISLSHYCRGVASDGKVLIISCGIASTMIVNLKDMSHTILYGVQTSRISIFQGHIYGTIWFEGKVSCYKSTGELLWTFVSDDIKNPRGLTVDKNGFVYLTCEGNNNVVVVSQDGKTCKTILSEADGIKHHREIDINRKTGTMIVSSRIGDNRSSYDSAFVYKI